MNNDEELERERGADVRRHRPSEVLAEELEPSMAMSVLLWGPMVRSSSGAVSRR